MPDRDDMPELGPDPLDETYLHAEQMLDDEDARAARRARILAAVAQEPAATPAPSTRRPARRYGGWLAAACVAGLSVWTAQQVYRSAPPPRQATPVSAPAAVAPPAPPAPSRPTAPVGAARPPAPRTPTARVSANAPRVMPRPPVAPPPDIAPPRPLPIPPVEKPIQASPPAPIASLSANIPAPPAPAPPPPPPPPAPVTAAKAGAAEPTPNNTVQSVVITGSRIERRDYTASSPAISQPLTDAAQVSDAQSGMLEARAKALEARSKALGARLHYDVAAGRIADIEPTLAQGAPVDAVDENGETALMKSIQTGQRDVAALLLRHGASLDLKNRAGVSARDMATAKNDPELDRALGLTP